MKRSFNELIEADYIFIGFIIYKSLMDYFRYNKNIQTNNNINNYNNIWDYILNSIKNDSHSQVLMEDVWEYIESNLYKINILLCVDEIKKLQHVYEKVFIEYLASNNPDYSKKQFFKEQDDTTSYIILGIYIIKIFYQCRREIKSINCFISNQQIGDDDIDYFERKQNIDYCSNEETETTLCDIWDIIKTNLIKIHFSKKEINKLENLYFYILKNISNYILISIDTPIDVII